MSALGMHDNVPEFDEGDRSPCCGTSLQIVPGTRIYVECSRCGAFAGVLRKRKESSDAKDA